MVTENTTPNRGYQEPAVGNTLEVDVGRLIAALRAIDTDMASVLAAVVAKAGLASPAFTGTPTAPTAAPGTDSGQLATTAFVKAAVAALVGLAPEALDTIEELAAASESNSDLIDLLEAAVALKADAATTTASLAGKEDLLSAATSDNTLDDTDEVVYLTGTTRKRGTLAGLITSIFKTTRKIANANFDTSLRLWDTTDNSKGLSFDLTGIATGQTRKVTMPDADVTLADVLRIISIGQAWQAVSRTINTSYQNTTGRAIAVSYYGASTCVLQVSTDNATWVDLVSTSFTATNAIIPPGHYYRFSGGTLSFVRELR